MLDNPDENGIYPTTKCFEQLDELFDKIVEGKQKRCAGRGFIIYSPCQQIVLMFANVKKYMQYER